MQRLVLLGDPRVTRPLLDLLPDGDYSVTVAEGTEAVAYAIESSRSVLLIASLDGRVPTALADNELRHLPWLAWNRSDSPSVSAEAYARGALAVLPAALTREAVESVLRTAFARALPASAGRLECLPRGRTSHFQGDVLPLDTQDVLVVEEGVIATSVLHADGTAVLTGICGPGQAVLGHPNDSCCLQLRAHTDVRIDVQSWESVVATRTLADRLRTRLRQQEAWAAMQARPHPSDRLLGLFGLLAEQFGQPHEMGTLIDLRLTHAQLAAAIGTTQPSIVRILRHLRKERLVTEGERRRRFVVRLFERQQHGSV